MINFFMGGDQFLSNFYPCRITYQSLVYPSVEHAYQASKTIHVHTRRKITRIKSAREARFYGKRIRLRKGWDILKKGIMLDLLRLKYDIPHIQKMLLDTGDQYIQEGNFWHDNYWGVCVCHKCEGIKIDGYNMLGVLTMKVREEIQNDQLCKKISEY